MKYLLSTGITTDKVEYYIIDLFKVYFSIYPGDIPGAPSIGFDFLITNTKKSELVDELSIRLSELLGKFANKFPGVSIVAQEVALINETTLKVILEVNQVRSEEILIDLFENK